MAGASAWLVALVLALGCEVLAAGAAPRLRIGVQKDTAPLAFIDAKGEPTGFTPELLRAAARVGGFEIELVPGWWNGNKAAFAARKLDVLGDITITDERKQQVDFSAPYMTSQQFMLVRADENLPYGKVAEVVKILHDAHLTRMGLVYSPQEKFATPQEKRKR